MSLLITPGQFSRRAELYHQLFQLTSAGLPIVRALAQLKQNPPSHSLRKPLEIALQQIEQGRTFAEALQSGGNWLPPFDLALLQAGEQSGRLPNCFLQLSNHYRERAKLVRQTIFITAYPLFILHLAIFLFPIERFTGLLLHAELFAFVRQKLFVLGPLWGTVALLILAGQSEAVGWRAAVERVLHFVPLLGHARRSLAIARLSSALEALISAGVNIIEAWDLAAAASSSPALQGAVHDAKPQLATGTTPSEMVRTSSAFPHEFADMYHTGEISGKLDESLERARDYFQDEGSRKLKQFITACAAVLIFTVILLVAWQIIHFYLGYFQQINNAAEGL